MSFWIDGQNKTVIVTYAEDKGTYGQIRFTTSRKDKKSGENKKSYFSFWNVVGSGYEGFDKLVKRLKTAPKFADSDKRMGVMIAIKTFSFDQEMYEDKDGEMQFAKQPHFSIWDWDFVEPKNSENNTGKSKKNNKGKMDTAPVVEDAPDEVEEDADDLFGADEDEE